MLPCRSTAPGNRGVAVTFPTQRVASFGWLKSQSEFPLLKRDAGHSVCAAYSPQQFLLIATRALTDPNNIQLDPRQHTGEQCCGCKRSPLQPSHSQTVPLAWAPAMALGLSVDYLLRCTANVTLSMWRACVCTLIILKKSYRWLS